MISGNHQPYIPKTILAIGAHADDIDVTAGGSIAAWIRDGAHVEYLIVTDGSKGTADTNATPEQLIQTRQHEQREAAQKLGVADVHFLPYEDGQLYVNQELKKDIVRMVRQVRPDTVITLDPTMVYSSELGIINHPDHRAVGQATLDAVFPLARDHLSFPDLFSEEKLEPHKVTHVLLIHFDKQDCFIDISGIFDLKLAALQCHASQFTDIDKVGRYVRDMAAVLGRKAGCEYAEGFVRLDLSE
ncbi:PIG-L family deacetylase [soil metagenome]